MSSAKSPEQLIVLHFISYRSYIHGKASGITPRLAIQKTCSIETSVKTPGGSILPHVHFNPLKLRQNCLQSTLKLDQIPVDDPTSVELEGVFDEPQKKYIYRIRVSQESEDSGNPIDLYTESYTVSLKWDFLNLRTSFFSDEDYEDRVDSTEHPFRIRYKNKRCSFEDCLGSGFALGLSRDGKSSLGSVSGELEATMIRLVSCFRKMKDYEKEDESQSRKNLMDYFEHYVPFYLEIIDNLISSFGDSKRSGKSFDFNFIKETLQILDRLYKVIIKPAETVAYKYLMGVNQNEVRADFYLNGQEEAEQIDQHKLLETAKSLFIRLSTLAGPSYNTIESIMNFMVERQVIQEIVKNILSLKVILYRHKEGYESAKSKVQEFESEVIESEKQRKVNDGRSKDIGLFWRTDKFFIEEVGSGLYHRLVESKFKKQRCQIVGNPNRTIYDDFVYLTKRSKTDYLAVNTLGIVLSGSQLMDQDIQGLHLRNMVESSVRGFGEKVLVLVPQKDKSINDLVIYSDKLRKVNEYDHSVLLKYFAHKDQVLVTSRTKEYLKLEIIDLKNHSKTGIDITRQILASIREGDAPTHVPQAPDLYIKSVMNKNVVLVSWIDYKAEKDVAQNFASFSKSDSFRTISTFSISLGRSHSSHEDLQARYKLISFPNKSGFVSIVMNEKLWYRIVAYDGGVKFTSTSWRVLCRSFLGLYESHQRFTVSYDFDSHNLFVSLPSSHKDRKDIGYVLKIIYIS